jgi:signal transduction protein with GAF and PtsI domain
MDTNNKINIDIFKVVTKAIAESDNLDIMTNNLTQLMVGALEIKGCTVFALNPDAKELEVLASFGMSVNYMNKGPVLCDNSIASALRGDPVVIRDIANTDQLQYPDNAKEEGIGAIVSVPINFAHKTIGALRLYHHGQWDISEEDLESLLVLGENIGLAMMYTKLFNAMEAIKEISGGTQSL